MPVDATETKISIPFPHDADSIESTSKGTEIVGILSHSDPLLTTPPSTSNRPIALILHGALAHKNQLYHRALAKRLDIDSFRFDFRANSESAGQWAMAGFNEDLRDLQTVIAHLRDRLGYYVQLMVGHSRGALDTWTYLARHASDDAPAESRVPYFVSLSGRWRMELVLKLQMYKESFEREGVHRIPMKVREKVHEIKIYPQDVEAFAKWPIADYVRKAPSTTDILMLHGTVDSIVPVSDISYYINELTSQERSATLRVHLVQGADHNFKGHFDEVVDTICSWFDERRAAALRRGDGGGGGGPGGADKATLQKSWDASVNAVTKAWDASVDAVAEVGKATLSGTKGRL